MPNTTKSKRVIFRLTPSEFAVLEASSKMFGVCVSDYMRALIQLPITTQFDVVKDYMAGQETSGVILFDKTFYPKLTNAINAWGRHYNQGIHGINKVASKRFLSQEDAWEMLGGIKEKLEEVQLWTTTTDAAIRTWPVASTAHVELKRVK